MSVVVPTRDRPGHLATCLAALRPVLRDHDELLVVDSASSDGAAVARLSRSHGAELLRCERPGASRARNAGWHAAQRDIVAFVDDDVTVAPGWACALAACFDTPGTAFATGRLVAPEGQRGRQRLVAIKDYAQPHRLNELTPAPLGSTANMAVRRAALEAVGGLDERLGGGARFQSAEDVDLFDRLLAAGYRGRYEPAAIGEHDQWRDRKALVRLDLRYGLGAGARLAKLVRVDRRRALRAVRESLWADGLVPLGKGVRQLHEFEVATVLARLAGTILGFAWGSVTAVERGVFR